MARHATEQRHAGEPFGHILAFQGAGVDLLLVHWVRRSGSQPSIRVCDARRVLLSIR